MSRREAGWVPDTQPAAYQGLHRTSEEVEAMRGYRLCLRCGTEHFMAYPKWPGRVCEVDGCECWCRHDCELR